LPGIARSHNYVKVVHDDLPGKGRAVQRGMLWLEALIALSVMLIFLCYRRISHFSAARMRDYEIAIASREAPGAVRYGEPFYRHVVGRYSTRWYASSLCQS